MAGRIVRNRFTISYTLNSFDISCTEKGGEGEEERVCDHYAVSEALLALATTPTCPEGPTFALIAALMMSMVMIVPVRPQPALQWTTMGTFGRSRESCSI